MGRSHLPAISDTLVYQSRISQELTLFNTILGYQRLLKKAVAGVETCRVE